MSNESHKARVVYTVDQYAADKKLPVDMLRTVFGIDDGEVLGGGHDGSIGVRIPYRNEALKTIATKFRTGSTGLDRFHFPWGTPAGELVYGRELLATVKESRLCVGAGESNLHAAAAHGIAMITVPVFSKKIINLLVKLIMKYPQFTKVTVFPDVRRQLTGRRLATRLRKGGWVGTVSEVNLQQAAGARDLCELHMKHAHDPGGFEREFQNVVLKAETTGEPTDNETQPTNAADR